MRPCSTEKMGCKVSDETRRTSVYLIENGFTVLLITDVGCTHANNPHVESVKHLINKIFSIIINIKTLVMNHTW